MEKRIWRTTAALVLGLLSTVATAQSSFTRRPTAYSGGVISYVDASAAYDGSLTTAATASIIQTAKGSSLATETWDGFPSAPSGVTQMQLNVNSAVVNGYNGTAIIYYSVDGGNSFTPIYAQLEGSRSQRTDVVPLADTLDITKVQVKAEIIAIDIGGPESTAAQWVYEIWISGTN